MQVLAGDLQGCLGFSDRGTCLGIGGTGYVQLAFRYRTIGDQRLIAAQIGGALAALGDGVLQLGLTLNNGRLGAAPLLQVVGQRGLLHVQLGQRLIQTLLVDAIVQPHQQVARLDELEVLHRHLVHVAAQLRADQRGLAPHLRIFGALDWAGERRQLPRIQNDQHTGQRDSAKQH